MSFGAFVSYCGLAPVPGAAGWNIDPILISALAVIGSVYALGCRSADSPNHRERVLFGAGLAIAAAALISPLCNLSVALFLARVTQHIVLTLVAAPLIALGRPERTLFAPRQLAKSNGFWDRYAIGIGAGGFAVTMWTWHLPGPYDATLQNNYAYWAMHITTFGSALILWHGLLFHGGRHAGSALLATFGTAMQMSFLGAVLTLAPKALFAVHFTTTWPWGLSPIEDQQLGGLIMWVPAGVLFTIYSIVAFGQWLAAIEAPPTAIEIGQSTAQS